MQHGCKAGRVYEFFADFGNSDTAKISCRIVPIILNAPHGIIGLLFIISSEVSKNPVTGPNRLHHATSKMYLT